MADEYTGPNRRHQDELYLQVREDLSALRQGLTDAQERIDKRLQHLEERQERMVTVVERGKVVVWVLSGLGGVLMWAETQWQVITKIFKSLSG